MQKHSEHVVLHSEKETDLLEDRWPILEPKAMVEALEMRSGWEHRYVGMQAAMTQVVLVSDTYLWGCV